MTRRELIETCRHADHLLRQHEPVVLRARVTDWLQSKGQKYATGVDGHDIDYPLSAWRGIEPWPGELASRDLPGTATVTRGEVVDIARICAESGRWSELLVAVYVWGYGPVGYGSARLTRILEADGVNQALDDAITKLRGRPSTRTSAIDAYESLALAITSSISVRPSSPNFSTLSARL